MMANLCEEPILDCEFDLNDEAVKSKYDSAIALAEEFIDTWTDGEFSCETIKAYPCGTNLNPVSTASTSWNPVLIRGSLQNICCAACEKFECGCSNTTALRIPGPIKSINRIVIDGIELDKSSYEIINDDVLLRLDGLAWPTRGSLDDQSFMIEYTIGRSLSIAGRVAYGILICEFYKVLSNDKNCKLPTQLKSIVREGITVSSSENVDMLFSGRTGIYLVDSWLASVMKQQTSEWPIASPDYNFRPTARQPIIRRF